MQYVGANYGDWSGRKDYSTDGKCQSYEQGLTGATGGGQAHSHGNTGSTALKTDAGGSTNVSNLQPYITCYIWKRIS